MGLILLRQRSAHCYRDQRGWKQEPEALFYRTLDYDPGIAPLVDYFQGVTAHGKTATVSFNSQDAMRYLNTTACMQQRVKVPIEKTLRVLLNIKDVKYRISGRVVEDGDG